MDLTTPFLTVAQLGLVPIVMALVSILKSANLTGPDNRFAPIDALILGMAGSFLVPSDTWQLTILAGITLGLIAAGVYSGVKATVNPTA